MFKLPKNLISTIDNYRESLKGYLEGKVSPDRFKGIRVPFGFYSQRASKGLMARVRIPAGCIASHQLKAIATVAKRFSLKPHITDRQDIQLHGVSYEDSVKVLDYLKDYDLSTIGGGGNTLRNITACYLSGICKDEIFDVRRYAICISEYLLKDPLSAGGLPRKFKIAFSGCPADCAYALVNDVGLIAKERDGIKGFRVYCGGGMGAHSAIGQVLEDFIPVEKTPYVVKAIMLAYNKHGDRLNRHKNRLRFLIQNTGFEGFRGLYLKELNQFCEGEYVGLRDIRFKGFKGLEPVNLEELEGGDDNFRDFLKYNVINQKQSGYYSVELNIAQGDITATTLEELAGLEGIITDIEFRTTQNQNLLLCHIPGKELPALYKRLKEIFSGPSFIGCKGLTGIVACKGATTCNLGLCNSPGLARAIIKGLTPDHLDMDSLKGFNIKISGCPNNCGQHILGVIGLQGLTRKVGLRPVPLYRVLLDGRTGEERTRFAQEVGIIPAKVVPSLLKDYFSQIQGRVKGYPSVSDFLEKEGIGLMRGLINRYSYVPDYEENQDYYRDWEREEDFSLAGIGPGECGAGVLDLIEADLAEAEKEMVLAKEDSYKIDHLRNFLIYSARALQVVKGLEPKTDDEVIESFITEFIDKGIADKRFIRIREVYSQLQKELTEDERVALYDLLEGFHSYIKTLYKGMDSHFRFPSEVKREEAKGEEAGKGVDAFMDLRGVKCPINYVKAKIRLETMERGQTLLLYLDEGEPIRNVPTSLKNDGQEILKMEKVGEYYELLVRKTAT